MQYKIYKKQNMGEIFFSKEFYTLPCNTNTILKLYDKLKIKNPYIIVTDISANSLEKFKNKMDEIEISENSYSGFDVYIKIKKECNIFNIITKIVECDPEFIFILENLKNISLQEIGEKYKTSLLTQLIEEGIIVSLLAIAKYENEICYFYNLDEKKIEERKGKYFVFP